MSFPERHALSDTVVQRRLNSFKFPRNLPWQEMENYARQRDCKYPEQAGELEDGTYYCVICASLDPLNHVEEAHRDFENWLLSFRVGKTK